MVDAAILQNEGEILAQEKHHIVKFVEHLLKRAGVWNHKSQITAELKCQGSPNCFLYFEIEKNNFFQPLKIIVNPDHHEKSMMGMLIIVGNESQYFNCPISDVKSMMKNLAGKAIAYLETKLKKAEHRFREMAA